MIGGGNYPQPGEILLAYDGVFFLDELSEFKQNGTRSNAPAAGRPQQYYFVGKVFCGNPSSFMLKASMNHCPCGYYNHPSKDCVCGPGVVQKYLNKISGPLLDWIDIYLEVVPEPFKKLV